MRHSLRLQVHEMDDGEIEAAGLPPPAPDAPWSLNATGYAPFGSTLSSRPYQCLSTFPGNRAGSIAGMLGLTSPDDPTLSFCVSSEDIEAMDEVYSADGNLDMSVVMKAIS